MDGQTAINSAINAVRRLLFSSSRARMHLLDCGYLRQNPLLRSQRCPEEDSAAFVAWVWARVRASSCSLPGKLTHNLSSFQAPSGTLWNTVVAYMDDELTDSD